MSLLLSQTSLLTAGNLLRDIRLLLFDMIKAHITKNEALMKMVRMFVAHYLTMVEGFSAFQNDSVTLLATWIVKYIKKLAGKVKSVANMQGKTECNIFHLMWCLQDDQLLPLKDIVEYLKSKREGTNNFNHQFFEKLRQEVFEDDLEKINKLKTQDRYSNIAYTKKTYTMNPKAEALPFKMSIHELYPFPPEYTYRQTRRSLQHEEMNNDYMNFLTIRENKRVLSEFSRKRERDQKEEQGLGIHPYELGVKKVKRVNLLKDI